jgi:hypothetical protein
MHAFIASPAMAKLVALSMVEEEIAQSRRARKDRRARAGRRREARASAAAKCPPPFPRPAST